MSTSEDDQAEARNDEVIRRVAEMKQILNTAEEYLDDDGEATDAESVVTQKSGTESEMSSNYGKLKHSDSLLLLTQVRLLDCCCFLITYGQRLLKHSMLM